MPLPSDGSRMRVTMRAPVRHLLPVLGRVAAERQLSVDHIYDY